MDNFSIILGIFELLTVISSVMVVLVINPVHAVYYLVLVFCLVSGIIFMLTVEFIGIIFIIVYVGAIAVLFLFVVMMLNINFVEKSYKLVRYIPLGFMVGIVLFYQLYNLLLENIKGNEVGSTRIELYNWVNVLDNKMSMYIFGEVLYTIYVYEFILSGVILLVAMIGTIVLTLNHKINLKRQEVYKQVGREVRTIQLRDVLR